MSKILPIFCIFILSSCVVGPDYHKPKLYTDSDLQENLGFNSTGKSHIDKDWYKQFNDNTLNTLITYSLRKSPNVKIAIERLREARSILKISQVNNLPMLNAGGSYDYTHPGKNIGYAINSDYYQSGLDASWEIDIWGGNRRTTESNLALAQAAAASLDNVRLSLTGEIATQYILLRQTQEQIRIALQNIKLQEDIYALVSAKNKYGLSDNIALNQSKYLLENTRSQIPTLQKQEEAYKNSLSVLLGVLPNKLDKHLQPKPDNILRRRFSYNLHTLYDLPISVLRNRPDIRIAEKQLHANNALVGKAIADLYPKINLSSFIGWQAPQISGLVNRDNYAYNFAPNVSLPIFHWGQLQNRIEQQKAVTRASFYQYQNAVLNAISEIRNSLTSLQEEEKRNTSAYLAAKAQKEVSSLTLNKYQQGLVEFTDVMTAQQQQLSAQNQLINSNGQIYLDLIAFYKSAGAGYSF